MPHFPIPTVRSCDDLKKSKNNGFFFPKKGKGGSLAVFIQTQSFQIELGYTIFFKNFKGMYIKLPYNTTQLTLIENVLSKYVL